MNQATGAGGQGRRPFAANSIRICSSEWLQLSRFDFSQVTLRQRLTLRQQLKECSKQLKFCQLRLPTACSGRTWTDSIEGHPCCLRQDAHDVDITNVWT